MNNQNKGNTNTVLIVIVLLLIVAFGAWWLAKRDQTNPPTTEDNGINIDVGLPGNSNQEEDGGSDQSY